MAYTCQYRFLKGSCKGMICGKNSCKKHNVKTNIILIPPKIDLEKKIINTEENIKQTITDLETSIENKSVIMKIYLDTAKLDTNTSEYYKNKNFIDQTLTIPWNKFYNIRETIGISNLENVIKNDMVKIFINKIKAEFDNAIYGMDNIKNEIINYICKFITNPYSQKNNIALYGSAGVCKTKFIKVLSSVLGLPLKIISLGGMKDSNYLLGHSFTYESSRCGIITQSIIDSQVMNPILYFDELDKVSNGDHGQDIYSVISNLTDPTLNSNFSDYYFRDLKLDLSKVFYIFTFNDISKINKVLLDRLNIIYIETPTKKDKIVILKTYCLNDLIENIGIKKKIVFSDDCYTTIIEYTDKQIDLTVSSGIREATRILEKILLEINKEIILDTFLSSECIITITHADFMVYFHKLKAQFIFLDLYQQPEHMYI